VYVHQLWLVLIGYGVVGGCGLGLGFNTPISTLIRWFPDRRGMATGAAIMGYGGGAMIAAPLSQALMTRFASETSVGVLETFIVLGVGYFVVMVIGSFAFRLPPPDWQPPGATEETTRQQAAIATESVSVQQAMKMKQFYLLWIVYFLNVTAGIGVLGQASAMIQEVFTEFRAASAAVFVALLSLFNLAGRITWASISDKIGPKATFAIFFTVGPLLYACIPWCGQIGSVILFVAVFGVAMTFYGAGFATMPTYCASVFGPREVSAIHGRVLTALSAAGVAGPVILNYLREFQINQGIERSQAYDITMFIMAGVLIVGFFVNWSVKAAVGDLVRWGMSRWKWVVVALVAIAGVGLLAGWLLLQYNNSLGLG
jgi:MFS family permease